MQRYSFSVFRSMYFDVLHIQHGSCEGNSEYDAIRVVF